MKNAETKRSKPIKCSLLLKLTKFFVLDINFTVPAFSHFISLNNTLVSKPPEAFFEKNINKVSDIYNFQYSGLTSNTKLNSFLTIIRSIKYIFNYSNA